MSLDEKFWSRVEWVDGHGLWTGGKNDRGYGGFYVGSRRYVKAHKYAWESKNGPVPEGMELGHTCEFRHCVIHVRPVTHAQNVKEGRVGTPEVNQKLSIAKKRYYANLRENK